MDITKGYCLAELQLVFHPCKNSHQPTLNAKLYAIVLWYSKIPPQPNHNTQMYEVYQEFNMKQEHKSGIVELLDIKGLCPLAPIFEDGLPATVSKENCFELIHKYQINCYASMSHFYQL